MQELSALLQHALTGDAEAYASVVKRFQRMAFGCAHAILGDFHLAEDACQEAFVQAFQQLHKLRDHERFPAWLRRIVRTQCCRLTRGWRPASVPLDRAGPVPSQQADPADRAETREIREKVREALRRLPEPGRTTATLFYIDGFDQARIADILEAPLGTVKRRLHDSRQRLKRTISPAVVDTWLDLPGRAVADIAAVVRTPKVTARRPEHGAQRPPAVVRRTQPRAAVLPTPSYPIRSEGETAMDGSKLNAALITFWDALENLQTAGLPLLRSLNTLADEASAPAIKTLAQCLAEQVTRGASLSEAMAALGVFLPGEVELIAMGEEGGTLDNMCRQVADKLRKGACLRERAAVTATGIKKANRDAALPDMTRKAEAVLKAACESNASDVHVEQMADETHVRYRIDGVLRDIEAMPKREGRSLCLAIKDLASMDLAETRLPQTARAQFNTGGKEYDLRIGATPTTHGESVTVRLLAAASLAVKLEHLCGPEDAEQLKTLAGLRHGLVFVTGPTGCGKTTILYALIRQIREEHPGAKLCSVEDPIEYFLEGVSQTQVDPSIGLTAAVALKHQLACDPDVILMGHLAAGPDDRETADVMVQGALSGHLLMATLHAQDAFAALKQVMELIPRRDLLADALAAITSQRLIRRVCQKCKTKYSASEEDLRTMGIDSPSSEVTLYKGKGCTTCKGTGYRGRMGIYEVLRVGDEVAEAIASAAELPLIAQAAIESGMRTLRQSGVAAALTGMTTLAEVLRVTGHRGT